MSKPTIWQTVQKIVVGILVVLLVLSFAVWGIGDVFRGSTNQTAFKVGDVSVSTQQYRAQVQRVEATLRAQYGELPPEVLKLFNPAQIAFQELMQRVLLDLEADRLDIMVGDRQVQERLLANKAFYDQTGKFDADRVDQYVRYIGLTRDGYINQLRDEVSRELLVQSLVDAPLTIDSYAALIQKHESELRGLDLLTVPLGSVSAPSEPDANALSAFYEANKAQFAAEESRDVTVVQLSVDDVKAVMDLSDERLADVYNERVDEFTQAATRGFDAVRFDDEAQAEAAALAMEQGATLEATGELLDFGTYDMEALQSQGLFAQETVEELFALKQGAVTKPQDGTLGWYIFRVRAINAPKAPSLAEVKDKLKELLIAEESEDVLYELSTQLEDALAGGQSLEDAAKELQVRVHEFKGLDAEGDHSEKSGDGVMVDYDDVVNLAFTLSEGEESSLVTSEEGLSQFIVRVDTVSPARERALDEVRGKVVEAWKKSERAKRVRENAQAIAKQLADGAEVKALVRKHKLKQKSYPLVYRDGTYRDKDDAPKNKLSSAVLRDAFALEQGKATSAYPTVSGDFEIAVVREVTHAEEDPTSSYHLDAVKERLETSVRSDLVIQYLQHLQRRYRVEDFRQVADSE